VHAGAQAAETIWLSAGSSAYKVGDTVVVTVNALSATPIQGFTFQIRYDPACLRPVNAASPIPAMNGLSLPQTAGLIDASFASTTPQAAGGVLAQVQFVALAGCQTVLSLESAALAIRNGSGFAAPLPGVAIGQKDIALNIDRSAGSTQGTQPVIGTALPLDVQRSSGSGVPYLAIVLPLILAVLIGLFGFFILFRSNNRTPR
jgi:cohesin domain-containing protein